MTQTPVPQEEKKGTNPLVWIAVGCAAVVFLGAIVIFAGGLFVFNKTRQVVKDDPVAAAARLIAAANPDIEIISTDREHRVVTVRNKKTGEEFTVDFEDIEKGKFRFHSDDQSVSFEIDEDVGEGTKVTLTTDESTTRIGTGSAVGDLPSYIPVYPGTTPVDSHRTDTTEGRSGAYTITTDDPPEEVLDYYATALEKRGFEILNRTTSTEGAFFTAQTADEAVRVNVAASLENGKTQVVIQFEEK